MEANLPLPAPSAEITALLILCCVLGVSFFSSSEASLISVSKITIRNLVDKGSQKAKAIERLISRHDRLFSTILATENMLIILATSLGTVLALRLFGKDGIAVATIVMTLFIVLFGEIIPKTLAARNAEKFSLFVARPMEFIVLLASPFVYLFTLAANGITRLLGGGEPYSPYHMTADELKTCFRLGEKEGILEADEKRMLVEIIDFKETSARQIMTPRTDMEYLQSESPISEVIRVVSESGHSRVPICGDNIDHIVGICYSKDVLRELRKEHPAAMAGDIMRRPLFVPDSIGLTALLRGMQHEKTSIAILLDEFGGTSGMVTMEDILEEIVGEIQETDDSQETNFIRLGQGQFLVNAQIPAEEAGEYLNFPIPEGDYNTLAGFISEQLGRIPKEGETLEFSDAVFRVEKVKGRKITQIRVSLRQTPPEREEDEI